MPAGVSSSGATDMPPVVAIKIGLFGDQFTDGPGDHGHVVIDDDLAENAASEGVELPVKHRAELVLDAPVVNLAAGGDHADGMGF